MRWRSEFTEGMGKRADDFVIILGFNSVFTIYELALVHPISPQKGIVAMTASFFRHRSEEHQGPFHFHLSGNARLSYPIRSQMFHWTAPEQGPHFNTNA
jgi:hypothetical protein